MRPPSSDEYRVLTNVWRSQTREERRIRFLARGGDGEAMDYFDHDFDFSQEEAGLCDEQHPRSTFRMSLRISMDACGTGATLWSCGLLLAECLWQGLVQVDGKGVLELGCGCAAVAAHQGASRVTATDFVAEVLESAVQNAGRHDVEVHRLDWSDHVRGRDKLKDAPDDLATPAITTPATTPTTTPTATATTTATTTTPTTTATIAPATEPSLLHSSPVEGADLV
ncbi:unnamed protein product, partial [Polarella glacialis]